MTAPDARGLHDKFRVTRTDGRHRKGQKHHECRHFVLDLDHDPSARAALMAYAVACRRARPQLSNDLCDLLATLPPEAL